MRKHLCIAPRIMGKATVASIDGLGVPVNEIVCHAEPCGRDAIGFVKTERTLQPRQCLCGSTRPHQDAAASDIVVYIARVELERSVYLRQCEIVTLPVKVDSAEQLMGPRCCRIQGERLLGQRFRAFEILCAELGPPRYDG